MFCEDLGMLNQWLPSLKLTWPLKMDGWNTIGFLLGRKRPIFRGKLAVSFRECRYFGIFFRIIVQSIYLGNL